MKFLIDQDVYAVTVKFLKSKGYDVLTTAEAGLSTASDIDVIKFAEKEERILLTRDKDFGNLVFVQRLGKGVIFLRMKPLNYELVHLELNKVLKVYSEDELSQSFVVVEEDHHRIRRVG